MKSRRTDTPNFDCGYIIGKLFLTFIGVIYSFKLENLNRIYRLKYLK